MSREIKFRIWDKICDRFFNNDYNYPVIITNSGKIGILVDDFNFEEFKKDELKNIVISEYTGLKDKNEKEIYDGDILFESFGERYYKVVFENGSYRAEFEEYSLDLIDVAHCCEIVGNIFENPELYEQLGY